MTPLSSHISLRFLPLESTVCAAEVMVSSLASVITETWNGGVQSKTVKNTKCIL